MLRAQQECSISTGGLPATTCTDLGGEDTSCRLLQRTYLPVCSDSLKPSQLTAATLMGEPDASPQAGPGQGPQAAFAESVRSQAQALCAEFPEEVRVAQGGPVAFPEYMHTSPSPLLQ